MYRDNDKSGWWRTLFVVVFFALIAGVLWAGHTADVAYAAAAPQRLLAKAPIAGGQGIITVVDTIWVDEGHAAIVGCFAARLSPDAPPSPMGCQVLYHVEHR